jgi:hypothetical protein
LDQDLLEKMSPQITRKFADMIDFYYHKISFFHHILWNKKKHISLCAAMFRSVLTPYLYEYDDGTVVNYFRENLVLQTLDSVPGLRTLRLTTLASREVARMIRDHKHLQVFAYTSYCTDEVTEQLGLHCHHLKEIDLCGSSRVTNASVQHLLRLRKLDFLNLTGTQIDNEHYVLLLSQLPQIKNIAFSRIGENILDHVEEENLRKISHVSGHVEDVSLLAQRCRNITNLDIYEISGNLSDLAALPTLRTVRIEGGDYAMSNVSDVLTGTGPRLTDLTLQWMMNVNLHDIVTLCQSLGSLSLLECVLLPLNPNTYPLDPQLLHFRNLTSLHITEIYQQDMKYNYIRHYVSLKTIRLSWINVFTVEFMREVVRSGALANLEELSVTEFRPGALTLEALELLIKHCPHLKTIEGLRYCPLLNPVVIEELKRRILAQNLELQIKH